MIDVLNYNYYGIPTGRYIYTEWDNDIHVADLVNDNMYNLYQVGGTPIPDRWGKPLDDSVYLWKIKPNCSFARNRAFCADIGNILNIETPEHVENSPVSLTVSCVDRYTGDYGEFNTTPHYRLANDDTKANGFLYNPLAYNIPYTSYCIHAQAGCFNYADKSLSGRNISALKAWIDTDPDNRDVWYLSPTLYAGTTTDRRNTDFRASDTNKIGAVLADILTFRPIPSNAEHVIHEILDGEPEDAEWDTTKVYNPFSQAIGQNNFWRGGNLVSTYTYQLRIGLQQYITYAQLRSGYADYSTISPPSKTTGQFFRASSDIQYYDDVAFRWAFKVYDLTTGVFLENGYDITNMSGACRLCTVLEIVDYKGQTKGEAVVRACLHEIAAIGFYFTDTSTNAQSYELGGNGAYSGVYLPEIVDGVTTGYYTTGEDVKNVPYFDADNVGAFKYHPSDTDDTGDWSYNINSGTIGAGVKYYALTEANMNNLCHWLNTTYNPTDQTQFIQDFKGQNPGDYLVSVMYYPFDIPVETGADETVVVGKLTATGSTGRVLKYKYGDLYNFGSYTIPAQGNFIDYMRKISVIVPFCGTKDLDPLIWTGQTLTVKMAIDHPTGACTAFLFRGVHVMDTLSGSVGVPLPLSALSNGNYQVSITNMLAQKNQATIGGITRTASGIANITGGVLDMKNAGSVSAGGVASIISGTVTAAGGAVQTAIGLPNLEYNIEHTQPEIKQIDGGSPFINCGVDLRVKILICTPVLAEGYDPAAYGRTTGYSCCKQGKLSSVSSGFTVCAGAQLDGIQATATEKSMIYNALQGGVFV